MRTVTQNKKTYRAFTFFPPSLLLLSNTRYRSYHSSRGRTALPPADTFDIVVQLRPPSSWPFAKPSLASTSVSSPPAALTAPFRHYRNGEEEEEEGWKPQTPQQTLRLVSGKLVASPQRRDFIFDTHSVRLHKLKSIHLCLHRHLSQEAPFIVGEFFQYAAFQSTIVAKYSNASAKISFKPRFVASSRHWFSFDLMYLSYPPSLWSNRPRDTITLVRFNVNLAVNFLMGDYRHKLLFCWALMADLREHKFGRSKVNPNQKCCMYDGRVQLKYEKYTRLLE